MNVEHNEYRTAARCPHCQDARSGLVAIWNPSFVEECDRELLTCKTAADVLSVYLQWRFKSSRNRYRTLAAACCCESPSATTHRKRNYVVYDPNRHHQVGTLDMLQAFLRDLSRLDWDPDAY